MFKVGVNQKKAPSQYNSLVAFRWYDQPLGCLMKSGTQMKSDTPWQIFFGSSSPVRYADYDDTFWFVCTIWYVHAYGSARGRFR